MNPLSGVLSEAWNLYRRYALHFLAIAFAIFLVAAIVGAVLTAYAGPSGYALAAIISDIALFIVEAALVTAVQDVRDGRVDLSFGQTMSASLPYLLPVALASILAGIGITIGFILIIVPGLILLTFWSLIVPAIVIGGAGPIEAFGRSWRTVRGYAWHVFGTYVLVFLIWIAAAIVLAAILLVIPLFARNFISNVIASTLVTPFLALTVTLIYYRLTASHAGEPAAAGPGSARPATGWSPQPPPAPPAPSAGGGLPPASSAQPPAGGFTDPPPPPTAPPPAGSTQPQPTSPPPAGGGSEPPAQPASEGFTQPAREEFTWPATEGEARPASEGGTQPHGDSAQPPPAPTPTDDEAT